MKKIISFLSMFFFCMLVLPICTLALEYETEISNNIQEFSFGNFVVDAVSYTEYSNFDNVVGKPGIRVVSKIHNNYGQNAKMEIYLRLYDKDNIMLGEYKEDITVNVASDYKFNFEIIEDDNISCKISDVKRFSLYFNVLTDVEREIEVINDSYYFNNYNVIVDVSEDNIYSIKEDIDMIFKNGMVPFVKEIPIRNKYYSNYKYMNKRSIISDIIIDDSYKIETVDGNKKITIGTTDKNIKNKNVIINYKYNVGKDKLNNNDEVVYYFNNTFETKIYMVDFVFNLPSEVDIIKAVFIDKDGHEIELENSNIDISRSNVSGHIGVTLEENDLVGIKILLPDNYFKNASNNIKSFNIITFIVIVIFIIISLFIWYIYNKNTVVNKSLYPYRALNPVRLGYLYNGEVKNNDIAALLFYLCNKGYIEIGRDNKKYYIKRLKKYKGSDEVEKIFMNELFADNSIIYRDDFSDVVMKLKWKINKEFNGTFEGKKVLISNFINYKIVFWLMVMIIISMITVNLLLDFNPSKIFINVLVSGIGYCMFLYNYVNKEDGMEKLVILLLSIILIVTPIALTSYKAFVMDFITTLIYVFGIIASVLIVIISSKITNRTRYGMKLFNNINYYKTYIVSLSNDVILNELENNSNYYYDILPYTFVLGINDRWFDKFNDIEIMLPKYVNKIDDKKEIYGLVKEIYSDLYFAIKDNSKM